MGKGKVIIKFIGTLILAFAALPAAAQGRSPANTGANEADTLIHQLPAGQMASSNFAGDKKAQNLLAGSVRYETIEDQSTKSIEISPSLIPSLIRNYLFTISPQMGSGKGRIERDRGYILRMVVLRPADIEQSRNSDENLDARYVAGTQELVFGESNGSIVTQLNLRFHSFTAMAMQNTLLIQVIPTKLTKKSAPRGKLFNGIDREAAMKQALASPDSHLNAIRMSVKFTPRQLTSMMSSVQKEFEDQFSMEDVVDLGRLIASAETQYEKIANTRLAPAAMAKALKADYYSLADSADQKALELARVNLETFQRMLSRSSTQNTVSVSKEDLQSLCALLNFRRTDLKAPSSVGIGVVAQHGLATKPQQAWIERSRPPRWSDCETHPENYFAISRNYHIEQLNQQASGAVGSYIGRLNLTGNFSMSRSHSSDVNEAVQQSAGIEAGVGLPSPPLVPIDVKGSIRAGLNYSYTISESSGRSKLESMVFTSGIDMEVPRWNLNLALKRYETCLLIVPSSQQSSLNQKKIYLCSGKTQDSQVNVIETLYHVYPSAQSAASAGAYDSRSQFVNVLLRGEREYVSLLQSIHKGLKPVQTQVVDKGDLVRTAIQSVRGMAPPLPGVYSEGLDLPTQSAKEPTFWDKFFHRYAEIVP